MYNVLGSRTYKVSVKENVVRPSRVETYVFFALIVWRYLTYSDRLKPISR